MREKLGVTEMEKMIMENKINNLPDVEEIIAKKNTVRMNPR